MACSATSWDCCPVAMSQWPLWSMAKPGDRPRSGSGRGDEGHLGGYAEQGEQAAGPFAGVVKTSIRGQCRSAPQRSPHSLGAACPGSRPLLSIRLPVVAIEGGIEFVEAIDRRCPGAVPDMAGPGAGGGVNVPNGMGTSLSSTRAKAAHPVLFRQATSSSCSPFCPASQGDRVGRHQVVETLVRGCIRPA